MAHDVFISYSSIDKTAADTVCSVLEQNGISCWIAPRDITLGLDFLEQAYEMHDPNVLYIGRPTYSALFNEPRFIEICRKLKIHCNPD